MILGSQNPTMKDTEVQQGRLELEEPTAIWSASEPHTPDQLSAAVSLASTWRSVLYPLLLRLLPLASPQGVVSISVVWVSFWAICGGDFALVPNLSLFTAFYDFCLIYFCFFALYDLVRYTHWVFFQNGWKLCYLDSNTGVRNGCIFLYLTCQHFK